MSRHDETRVFHRAFAWLMSIEGGYVNDPDDPGGETNYGISKRAHPDLDIANLTQDQASAIYFQDYWLKAGCNNLKPRIGFALWDAAVNHGARRAVIQMQEALLVRADGINGPKTQSAARAATEERLLVGMLTKRAQFYVDIVLAKSNQAKFLRGWFRRLFKLQAALYGLPDDDKEEPAISVIDEVADVYWERASALPLDVGRSFTVHELRLIFEHMVLPAIDKARELDGAGRQS